MAKKRAYCTNLTRDYELTTNGEVNHGVSLTVPDMCVPLSELVVRYVRGEAVDAFPLAFQDEDDDDAYPDLRSMDFVELQDLRDEVNSYIEEARASLKESSGRANVSTVSVDEVDSPSTDSSELGSEGGASQAIDAGGA